MNSLQSGKLIRPFSLEEVKQSVWDCDSFKSPDPVGIKFDFIKDFWDVSQRHSIVTDNYQEVLLTLL